MQPTLLLRSTGLATLLFSVLIAVTLAGFALWVHLAQFSAILQWDSHVYLLIGRYIHHGLLPYRDLWEVKPPGIFWYLAAIFWLLPTAIWSVRLVDFVWYLFGAIAFYRLCRAEAIPVFAAIGSATWLYYGHHPAFDLGGVYTEEYSAVCAVLAMSAASAYSRTGRLRTAFATGLAVAAAALFKHPGAGVMIPALLVMTARPKLRAFLLFMVGAATPVALVVIYFWSRGAFSEFVDCNVWSVLRHGGLQGPGGGSLTARLGALGRGTWEQLGQARVLVGAVAVGVPVAIVWPTRLRLAATIWLLSDLLAVAAQNHYYQHHYIQVFPSICLLGTLAAAWLLQPRRAESWLLTVPRLVVAAAMVVITWPVLRAAYAERETVVSEQWGVLLSGPRAWQQNPGRSFEEEIGRYVRDRTQSGDRLHVQGWNGTTLGIYWVADRLPASRYFYEVPFGYDRQAQLADLQHNAPEYVLLIHQATPIFLTPWLAHEYAVEAVKWQDYRAEIWARVRVEAFAAGTAAGLSESPSGAGLMLEPRTVSPPGRLSLLRTESPRRGHWTSPVLPIRSDDGTALVDWSPRSDLASNRTGRGFPRAEATDAYADTDVRAVLGFPAVSGHWSSRGRAEAQSVTIDLGFPAVIDRVVIEPHGESGSPLDARLEIEARSVSAPDTAADFAPIAGTWEVGEEGGRVYRFAPQVVAALRVIATPGASQHGVGLRRIRIPAVGMGATGRYRTGPTADLDDAPWVDLAEGEEPLWIQGDRYVQVQIGLWSAYRDQSPVLHAVQLGRVRFESPPSSVGSAAASRP